MSDNITTWRDRDKAKRNCLKDVLPLDTPFSLGIEPINGCNFRCRYCVYASDKYKASRKKMSIENFRRIIGGCISFPKRIRTISLYGFGEPLLNKNLPLMIEESYKAADEVSVLTNGSLITKEFVNTIPPPPNNTLRFRISLQGLCTEDYLNVSGAKINFQKFLENIDYLHKSKKCQVFAKIVDIAVDTQEKKEKLHKIFDGICDGIIIENVSPLFNQVDYSKVKLSYDTSMFSNSGLKEVNVCPQPFMTMDICADGSVYPCCQFDVAHKKLCIGNAFETPLPEIWNGAELKNLRLKLLGGIKNFPVCAECNQPKFQTDEFSNIDSAAERLLAKYS